MTTKNAAIYLRVSTEDQTKAHEPEVQRQRCTAQAIAKGYQVFAEFYEVGISGSKGIEERPALGRSGENNAWLLLGPS